MIGALPPLARIEAREQGTRLHPVDRALLLLDLAAPNGADDLSHLPLAKHDQFLLAYREATFGDRIACVVDCPHCAAPQEFDLSAKALMAGLDGAAAHDETLDADGWRIGLRPLQIRDLAAAARQPSTEKAAALLVAQAIAEARGPAGEGFDQLPQHLWPLLEARVAEREAAAEIALHLTCPGCGQSWTAGFDIGACFWSEVDADARRLLGEVAALAERFGWSETELLAMSPARRRAYLQLVGAS